MDKLHCKSACVPQTVEKFNPERVGDLHLHTLEAEAMSLIIQGIRKAVILMIVEASRSGL